MADDSKTEKATPKKRRDERKKGHVPLSKDMVSIATLIGSVLILRLTVPGMAQKIHAFMTFCFTLSQYTQPGEIPRQLLMRSIELIASVLWPLLLMTVLVAVAATMGQTRGLVAAESIKPKFDKLNPISGFKNMFSLKNLVEVLKNLIKITILLYILYTSVRSQIEISEAYLRADLNNAIWHVLRAIFNMLLKVSAAFFVIAVIDFFYQRWQFERDMKMSKQEVKEEYKQTEGDPQVKGKIKEVQRRMAQSRMMAKVPEADVIIRNPTHVAVALRYHAGEDAAPVVLAKGIDYMAKRIVDVAQAYDIVTIENVPLARALYAQVELDQQIPAELYEAVAEVMVYLYRLGRVKA